MATTYSLAPVITDATDNYGNVTGKIYSGMDLSKPLNATITTDDNRPVLHGTAEPGMVVSIYDNYAFDPPIGQVVAGDDWAWEFKPTNPLVSGIHTFTLMTPANPEGSYSFYVNHELPPVITDVTSTGNNPAHIDSGAQTDSTTVLLKGTAEPGSTIDIYDNGVKIGSTTNAATSNWQDWLSGDGWNWSFSPAQPLSTSTTHAFSAISHRDVPAITTNIYDSGTHTDYDYTIGIGVTPPQPALLAPVITSVVSDVGTNQGPIPDGGHTFDPLPTLNGTSEPGTIVTVSDNGHVIGTAITGADWQWSFTPSIGGGDNAFTVTAARPDNPGDSTAGWYSHLIVLEPPLESVLTAAGLSTTEPQPAPSSPAAQAAYFSEATQAAPLPQHDLAY